MPDVSNKLFVSAFVWIYTWKNSAFVSNTWLISSINDSPNALDESCMALIPLSSGFLSMFIKIHDWSVTPKTQLFSFVSTTAWILPCSLSFSSNSVGIIISWMLVLSRVTDTIFVFEIFSSIITWADSWKVDKPTSCEYPWLIEILPNPINIAINSIFSIFTTLVYEILNLLIF